MQITGIPIGENEMTSANQTLSIDLFTRPIFPLVLRGTTDKINKNILYQLSIQTFTVIVKISYY